MANRKATSRVKVVFEQDGTGWKALAGGQEVWGRSLSEAKRKIRKALGATASKKTEIVEDVRLPGNAQKELERYAAARERAQAEMAALWQATRAVVATLTRKHRISLRDASAVLGL